MPPPIRLSDLDLFALVDADTDEAKTFTTYMFYWDSLAANVELTHGTEPTASVLADLNAQTSFRSLAGKGKPQNPVKVRELLLNGWTSELRLHLIPPGDAARLWIGNHGAPIDAYYATSRLASAFLLMRDNALPETHSGLLRAVSSLVSGQRLLPHPWDLTCLSIKPATYGGFQQAPGSCSNLATNADPYDRTAMLLRTTRERGVATKVKEMKKRLKTQRAPNGESKRQDDKLGATTVFDFTWRMRTRSNYGDPGMFHVGTLTEDRSTAYATAVRSWTTATMGLFEALVAQRAPALLEESAVYFLSRDRSGIGDGLLAPRLRALGLLAV
jgi:hypothetical protein